MPQKSDRKIYILFDSVHDNTGDRAIGEALVRFAALHGAEVDSLDPLHLDGVDSLPAPVLVGGGELIHPPGDPFYDAFRLSGRHILNTVGVTTEKGLEFLEEYGYVSVRSELDKTLVEKFRPDVTVAPCMSIALEPTRPPEDIPSGTVLVHAHFNMAHHIPGLASVLEELTRHLTLRWISLTPYAGDRATMYRVAGSMSKPPPPLKAETPRQKMGAISRAQLLICGSLHGAMFAHVQNVPFLVYAQPPKVAAFLADRGLGDLGFTDEASLRSAIERVLERSPDFSETIERDQQALREHEERLAEILGLPPRKKKPGPLRIDRKRLYHETEAAIFDGLALRQAYREIEALSLRASSLLNLESALREHREELARWRKIAKDYEEDRDRWKQRCRRAEAALETQHVANEMLPQMNHWLAQIAEGIRRQQEGRLSERSIKYLKRMTRAGLSLLPERHVERGRGIAERLLGRPAPPFPGDPMLSENGATRVVPSRVDGGGREPPARSGTGDSNQIGDSRAAREGTGRATAMPRRAGLRASSKRGPVGILIPTYNAGPGLKELLESVSQQRDVKIAEVVVVDSSSDDGTPDCAGEFGATVEVIDRDEFNHGRTRNHLASLSNSPYLLFLTQDAILGGPYTLERLLSILETDSRIAAVSARQVPRSDADLYGAYTGFFHSRSLGLDRDRVFPDGGGSRNLDLDEVSPVTRRVWASVDNVCAAYRRDVWDKLRFRELDFAEDLDFGLRALAGGWKTAFCHSAAVIHSHDRPALYHLRRHVADKLFVAPLIDGGRANSIGSPAPDEALASAAAVARTCILALERRMSELGISSLAEFVAAASELVEDAALSDIGLLDAGEGPEGEPVGVPNPQLARHREVREVVGWLDRVLGANLSDGRPSDGLGLELCRFMGSVLASPLLEEFVEANRHAPSTAAADFVVRLVAASLGSFLGGFVGQLPDGAEARRAAIAGV